MNLRLVSVAVAALFVSTSARAEDVELFGKKPYSWGETRVDQRFTKTRIYEGLSTPPQDAACARVIGTLLLAFSEAAPYLHKRDENFFLDPGLVRVLQETTSNERFPAINYLVAMVRRTMIDKKAPEAWLNTAKALKKSQKAPIDLARLAYAVDGPDLIDNFQLTLPMLMNRFVNEVLLAPSIAQDSAKDRFEERYLDRDVAWGGLILHDIQKQEPPPPPKPVKGKKGKKAEPPPEVSEEDAKPKYWAVLWLPQPQQGNPIFGQAKVEPVRILAKLSEEQYVDLKKVARADTFLVKGRLWSLIPGTGEPNAPAISEVEIRDAVLFEDRSWGRYAGFASPDDVAACPMAINDLSDAGLRDTASLGKKDGFEK